MGANSKMKELRKAHIDVYGYDDPHVYAESVRGMQLQHYINQPSELYKQKLQEADREQFNRIDSVIRK